MRTRPVDAVTTDVRFALRTLRKAPGFTAVVMLTLALGIGATTAIFTIVDAVLLRPYPYADMDRIVVLAETTRTGQTMSIAWANFQDWREQNQLFEHLGIYRGTVINLTGGDQPERLIASLASSEVFKAVGLQAMIGRTFTADEDRAGAPRIAVVSDRFWRMHLDADAPRSARRSARRRGAYRGGVMPPCMRFPSRFTDVWLPVALSARPSRATAARIRACSPSPAEDVIGAARASADMDAISRRLEQQYPQSNTDHPSSMESYYEQSSRTSGRRCSRSPAPSPSCC